VKGDLHDMGDNLVKMMLESAGFRTIDLGVDVPAEDFVAAVREHQPNILMIPVPKAIPVSPSSVMGDRDYRPGGPEAIGNP